MKQTLKLISFLSMAIMLSGLVAAQYDCGNNGFNCECQNYYGSPDYYSIEKFAPSGESYALNESNPLYGYFSFDVTGDLKEADWASNYNVYSVLVKAGNDYKEFSGGASGNVDSVKDISHITFCGYRDYDDGSGGDGGNGVPEFSLTTLGIATVITALGLVYLRNH